MSLQVASDSPPATHYHIQWCNKDTLDWEPFDTYSAAEEFAKDLTLRGEDYTIKERGEDCPRCISAKAARTKSRVNAG